MTVYRRTPALQAYSGVARLLGPVASAWLDRRAAGGKEDRDRLSERRGIASLPRPGGALVWLHAASVGESLVALSLADGLLAARSDLSILITSGTLTSANLIAQRAPGAVLHQFVPVDHPGWAARFIAHWRPEAGVFLESELWPNLIAEAARAGVPLALANARMNDASIRSWGRFSGAFRALASSFDWIGAADARTAQGLERLTGKPPALVANLKLEAAQPDPDPDALAQVRAALGARPVFTAASTHAGEEAILARAHAGILKTRPDALMILAPRHPARTDEAGEALRAHGLAFARRSDGAAPDASTPVWLADTLGEMGLWYALSPVAVIGGSFIDAIGGHNPVEATRAGSAVVTGPFTASFADVYAAYRAHDAVLTAATADEIAGAVLAIWDGRGPAAEAGKRAIASLPGGALARTSAAILSLLSREARS
ncbi:3-deoxy-D-manno-octulosonic acid transferase [Hyphomonadaceae bacterium BL14]|nr:3-deoxy-D-manno-octulosonic acid transferase [Hyphomonadaceae bacterium BL14]